MITYKKEGIIINRLEFYMEENGNVPVKEFLMSLPSKLRAKAFSDIELLEKHGSDLREPHVKAIRGSGNRGLFELRIRFSSDIARVFYFTYHQGTYVLLHGFLKKTMKTPKRELERARCCMDDYKRRMEYEQSRS